MSGTVILYTGIGMTAVSVVLIIVGAIYRNTAGKRIRKELMEEYR